MLVVLYTLLSTYVYIIMCVCRYLHTFLFYWLTARLFSFDSTVCFVMSSQFFVISNIEFTSCFILTYSLSLPFSPPLSLCLCLSFFLFLSPSISVFLSLSPSLSVCLSLSVCVCVSLSLFSLSLSLFLCLSISLSLCLCLSLSLSLFLSVCVSLSHPLIFL